jgi:HD-like signal output (HDOD) protein
MSAAQPVQRWSDNVRFGGDASGYVVQEFRPDDEDVENRLLFDIYQAYADNQLEIPAVPELAERIRRAVDDTSNGAAEVARVVQADPAVAARVVRVANSAAYAGKAPARNLREAVVRLGLQPTRDLVVAVTMQQIFSNAHAALRRRLLELWRHSTHVAAVTFSLARRLKGMDAERALLAGLLHDIGAAVLITHAGRWPELVEEPKKLERVVGSLGGEIGVLALSRWGFEDDLLAAAREAESWQRQPSTPPELCDVVLIAQLYALSTGEGAPAGLPALDSVPAYTTLGLATMPAGDITQMLREAQQEIMELRRLLLG